MKAKKNTITIQDSTPTLIVIALLSATILGGRYWSVFHNIGKSEADSFT